MLKKIYTWVTKNPNRVVLYLTSLANILVALTAVAVDLDATQVAAVLGVIASIDAKVITWIKGWQQVESTNYTANLMAMKHNAELESIAQASKPSSVRLPR